MIKIDIEDGKAIAKTSRKGSTYHVQKGYLHSLEKDGTPKRYPEEFEFFVGTSDRGAPESYPPGSYTIHPTSMRVQNNNLEIGYLKLVPFSEKKSAASA